MRQRLQHRAELGMGGAAAAQFGGNAGREDVRLLEFRIIVADEAVVGVVAGRAFGKTPAQAMGERHPILGRLNDIRCLR